jgi:hypothetical protein
MAGWKLWGCDSNGNFRFDDRGGLDRRNVGPVSILASPAIEDGGSDSIERLFDVEGESDFLAAVESGLRNVIATTGGANALTGHERHRDWLLRLDPEEVAVIRDLDDAGRVGAEKAAEWWLGHGVSVRVVGLPEALGEKGDLRDYLNGCPASEGRPAVEALGDADSLAALVDAAERLAPVVPKEPTDSPDVEDDDLDSKLEELAQLSRIEYDRCRKEEAKALGLRTQTLDAEVAARRPQSSDEGESGTALVTAIDYATHTLTLDAPLTWSADQGVALAYSGSAPDPGAYERTP